LGEFILFLKKDGSVSRMTTVDYKDGRRIKANVSH